MHKNWKQAGTNRSPGQGSGQTHTINKRTVEFRRVCEHCGCQFIDVYDLFATTVEGIPGLVGQVPVEDQLGNAYRQAEEESYDQCPECLKFSEPFREREFPTGYRERLLGEARVSNPLVKLGCLAPFVFGGILFIIIGYESIGNPEMPGQNFFMSVFIFAVIFLAFAFYAIKSVYANVKSDVKISSLRTLGRVLDNIPDGVVESICQKDWKRYQEKWNAISQKLQKGYIPEPGYRPAEFLQGWFSKYRVLLENELASLSKTEETKPKSQAPTDADFETLLNVWCCMLVADRKASKAERKKLHELLNRSGVSWDTTECDRRMKEFFERVKSNGLKHVLDETCEAVRGITDSHLRSSIIVGLDEIAEADGTIHQGESAVRTRIVAVLKRD
ncbi:MAG: hypothetical protein HON53_17110 [Planctomycetaceae bacterium]|jgi:uncharacterized tellurite resistance protein B-like protein|nr:hypothetical protein [Planctomycetaceae bacterium]MBT6153925.1 hypothetical protein [Planctomycetaceae bacterium]MBT6483773.1 hypothetical protein [Planctomycetaceae bacterium]MBT6494531.1 hypothetical protein [Planctomycetaceae bacterium]